MSCICVLEHSVSQQSRRLFVAKYLEERANKRNGLLYAAQEGAPEVKSLGNFLPIQRINVLML
jgi:hypothetical protein